MPKKTLIIKLSQDVSEYDDEYIKAMQIMLRYQAKKDTTIEDVDFELIVEDEKTEAVRVNRMLDQVRAEFREHDQTGDGVEVTIRDGDERY